MTAIDHSLAALAVLTCLSQLFVRIDPARYSRYEFYQAGAATGILFGMLPLLGWWPTGRPLASFGLHGWNPAGALAWGAGWALLMVAAVLLIRRGLGRRRLVAIYRPYDWLMPRSRGELVASWGASLSAGIGEEIAFRGFLLWYATAIAGAPAGLLISSLLFGVVHAYQRARGIAWATGAGLVLGLGYLASESLLFVIWMHATWNVASFTVGRIVLAAAEPGTGEARRVPL